MIPTRGKPACYRAVRGINKSPHSSSPLIPGGNNDYQEEDEEEDEALSQLLLSRSFPSAMNSLMENFQKRKFLPPRPLRDDLPVFQAAAEANSGLRRRLSSSATLQSLSSAATASSTWALRRSKSMSAVGELAGGSLRRWWEWGRDWVLSRKPSFTRDLEMSGDEMATLGCQTKGSLRHFFYKVRSELKRIVGSGGELPISHDR